MVCLVVDDDNGVRRALLRVLQRAGYRGVGVRSGREALERLEREGVDVVLTDIQMPEMDGIELLREVCARWPDVAVVMVTGVSEVSVAVSCLKIGALDFVTKPFQIDDVRARVSQALDKRRLILENREYQNRLEEMVHEQAIRIEEVFIEGVQTLAHALDAKDSYTKGHSARVSAYAESIARRLGLSEPEVQLIKLGAELHDIGKIGVPESLLQKPSRLTKREYRQLMRHTVIGEKILASMLKNAPEALAIVRSHHERLDGSGLPDGLAGAGIPVPVRIVTVADSFDAMTTARPYRHALDTEAAVAELRRCIGSQFDPDAVEAFLDAYPPRETRFPITTPQRVRLRLPDRVAGLVAGAPRPSPVGVPQVP